jgi:tetratricopeptide (TPR) repeat protein
MADSMTTLDLFQAGVALFRTKRYSRAAEAFERGLTRNPHYRDALYNLANTYLSLANAIDSTKPAAEQQRLEEEIGNKMGPITANLVAVDPASTAARRLQAAAFQLAGLQDSTLAALERIEVMSLRDHGQYVRTAGLRIRPARDHHESPVRGNPGPGHHVRDGERAGRGRAVARG